MSNIYLDAEYNQSNERHMGLVSMALSEGSGDPKDYWLADNIHKPLKDYLEARMGQTLVCFNADAEARCVVALGLNPLDYQWIDLYLDYRQLQNKDVNYQFGKYMDKDVFGRPVVKQSMGFKNRSIGEYISPKDFERQKAINKARAIKKGYTIQEVTPSLLNATLNFTTISNDQAILDATQKREMRDVILGCPERDYTMEQRKAILDYGRNDISDLKIIMDNMGDALVLASKQTPEQVLANRLFRGRVGAMMAMVVSNGTPLCRESLNNLTANALKIENTAKAELNMRTGYPLCQWKGKGVQKKEFRFDSFSKSYKAMEDFILLNPVMAKNWPKTKEGKFSLSNDTIENYKSNPVIKEYRGMLKTCNAMKYSKADESGKSPVGQAMGDDDRLRCTLFPYGTQTGRNAARARQYIYAQGAWLKAALIKVPLGKKLIEIDLSSCEFFIGAALSGDKAMMEAYKSDVYVAFGVAAHQYPSRCDNLSVAEIKHLGHTDQEVGDVRQRLKGVVLGMSYGAGAETISVNTGLPIKLVEKLIAQYKRTYATYYRWREKIWAAHLSKVRAPIALGASGWYLGKDNDNKLSTQNYPVQGTGATILHISLDKSLSQGIEVINTLHDAQYILVDEDDDVTQGAVEKNFLDASYEVLGLEGMKVESEIWHHGERIVVGKGAKDWAKYQQFVISGAESL